MGFQPHPAIAILLACVWLSSCSTPPAAPSTVSLSGTVTALGGAKLPRASVRIVDGVNMGLSTTTNDGGGYRFDGLAAGLGRVSVAADGYDAVTTGSYIDGRAPLDFALRATIPWSKEDTGAAAFKVPDYVRRVRLVAVYNAGVDHAGGTSPFTFRDEFCLFAGDSVGAGERRVYEGVYQLHSGFVYIDDPTGTVMWSLTEERVADVTGNCGGYLRPGS